MSILGTLALLMMPGPELPWHGPEHVEVGWLSRYAPGVMDDQVTYRIGTGEAPADAFDQFQIFIAVEDCGKIGDVLFIRPYDSETGVKGRWKEALVVDCAGDVETVEWMQTNHILAEVSAEIWDAWQVYRTDEGLGVEIGYE